MQQHPFLFPEPAAAVSASIDNMSSSHHLQLLNQQDKKSAILFVPRPANVFSYYVNVVVIPLLLTFGAVGNLVSLVVLFYRPFTAKTRRRYRHFQHHIPLQYPILAGLDQAIPPVTLPWFVDGGGPASFGHRRRRRASIQPLERVAMVGLGCLAVSDLAFCLVGVPAGLLALNNEWSLKNGQLYRVYRHPLHNTFLLSSTWITVCVAVQRFFAVVKPLRARWTLKVSIVCHYRKLITAQTL